MRVKSIYCIEWLILKTENLTLIWKIIQLRKIIMFLNQTNVIISSSQDGRIVCQIKVKE